MKSRQKTKKGARMRYIERKVNKPFTYVLPIGDIHIGDKFVNYDLLRNNLQWAKDNDALIIGTGDWLNVATRTGKSSPFTQNMDMNEQVTMCNKLFEPVKHNIIGVIQGNHEARLEKECGYDPLTAVCLHLGIEYMKYSGIACIIVGQSTKKSIGYTFYVHHSTGGGQTPGSKINRVDKLRGIVSNADAYLGGHNHSLGVMPVSTRCVDVIHKSIEEKRQMLIDCGSYLKFDENYAEQMGLQPTKLGSPRIRLDGNKRDIHVSV
jgi:hypothetical protein